MVLDYQTCQTNHILSIITFAVEKMQWDRKRKAAEK